MAQLGTHRTVLSAADIAMLGEREALQRLELLASTGRILDATLEDFDLAMVQVAEACVVDFADLCAIEVIGSDGVTRTVAYRFNRRSNLTAPERWAPVGRRLAPDRKPVLTYPRNDEGDDLQKLRERLGAQSMIAVPIAGGGLTLGWLVAATGDTRRGFRPSAVSIGAEMGARLSNTIQRAMLLREMQASVREQTRTVRRLRRLATAATNLAGAATPQAVLDVACFEACVIHDAGGAVARWIRSDDTVVEAEAGRIDRALAEHAFSYASTGRPSRGDGWVAYPLPSSDPWERASLVVFVGDDFATEEELVLSSLVSLVPVAFERAVGTEAAMLHEVRLRAVVEGSPVALVGLDSEGRVNMANRSAQSLFGWPSMQVGLQLQGEMSSSLRQLADEVFATGEVVSRSARLGDLDISLTGAPLPGAHPNEPDTVLVAGMDLTDIHRAEQALVQAQRLEAMGLVAGRVAHDFNNVLTLIVGYAQLLKNDLDDAGHRALLDNIDQATRRAGALTQQMLGMSRRRAEADAWADAGREIADLRHVMSRLLGSEVELTVEASGTGLVISLDPSELEQIVLNLVINASDAMNGSGRITVAAQPGDDGSVVLTVSDTGPGMTPDVLSRCLEPFYTTKSRGHGSGLGLSTVYGLVRDAGGRLDIDSSPGEGTEVRICLPSRGPRDGLTVVSDDDRVPLRVLLVEDQPDLREAAATALREAGFVLTVASSAELALDALAAQDRFDLILTDVILPGKSGPELAAHPLVADQAIPVLFTTGSTGMTALHRIPAGAQVLRKPYTSSELVDAAWTRIRAAGQDGTPADDTDDHTR